MIARSFRYGFLGLIAVGLICFGWAQQEAADSDDDGMMDAFECFYGLDPEDAEDSCLNFDGDCLSNFEESLLLTDPFEPDTDRDGFDDGFDANPISRAYLNWGAPWFTERDYHEYAHPNWFLAAYKTGGEWLFDLPDSDGVCATNFHVPLCRRVVDCAWYVPAEAPPDTGSLSIELDRALLTNNLVLALHYQANSNASLYVELLDTNSAVLDGDLFGNLMQGGERDQVALLQMPLAEFRNAVVVRLRRGTGEVMVFESLLYIDEDMDGLDADQEAQLGTSDYRWDTDGDGISDWDEVFVDHTDPCNPEGSNGGDEDPEEQNEPTGIIYVDQVRGNDRNNGRVSNVSGNNGPKKTIEKGMLAVEADKAHTLIIKTGDYQENLDLSGRNVQVIIEGNVRL